MRMVQGPVGQRGLGGMMLAPWEAKRPAPVSMGSPTIGGGMTSAASEALQRAMAYYQPGGGYGAGVEAGLERGRVKSMASGMQSLVSAGLAGTTMAAGLGKKYEEEVAMPARARVEETRAGAISGLEAMKAQIIQGATESARSRALQEYLARLQSSTSLQLGAMRQPSLVSAGTPAPTGEKQPAYDFPTAPSLVSAGVGRGPGGSGVNIPTAPVSETYYGAGAGYGGSEIDWESYSSDFNKLTPLSGY